MTFRDIRDYRAAFSRCVDLAEEWQDLDYEPATDRDLAILTAINRCGRELAAVLVPDGDDEPKPTARPPHPATMIGRTNRAVCLLDADCIAGVDHDGECIQ